MFCFKLPQNRHPERSAPQIGRVTQRLMARSRRTSKKNVLSMLFGAFQPPKPENRILAAVRIRWSNVKRACIAGENENVMLTILGLGPREKLWQVYQAGF